MEKFVFGKSCFWRCPKIKGFRDCVFGDFAKNNGFSDFAKNGVLFLAIEYSYFPVKERWYL